MGFENNGISRRLSPCGEQSQTKDCQFKLKKKYGMYAFIPGRALQRTITADSIVIPRKIKEIRQASSTSFRQLNLKNVSLARERIFLATTTKKNHTHTHFEINKNR